jgi:hypothetical protein
MPSATVSRTPVVVRAPLIEKRKALKCFGSCVAQVKINYDKAKAATEEAADLLKSGYATAAKGATDYNHKVIEIARANTNTAFDYAYQLKKSF